MTAIPDTGAGDAILASWGQAVADLLNEGATVQTANSSGITTTQVQMVGRAIAADELRVGTCFRFDIWATLTSTASNVVTFRIRCGSATLTGTIVTSVAPTATTTASNDSFHLMGLATVRSIGASGTIIGALQMVGGSTQPFTLDQRTSVATAAITIDTTAALVIEATAQTAAGTTTVTVRQATIEIVRP